MTYINTALNYTGSKFRLLDQIIPEMNFTKKYFIDLFAGSGVVGFNVVDKYQKILTNDILKNLIEIHKEIIFNSDDFIKKVKSLVVSKDDQEGFNELRKNFNNNNTPEGLYALILCSTNNMMRYNQKFEYNQTFGKRTYNLSIEKKLNEFIKYIEPYKNKIHFSHKHFSEILITKPAMVYIDSPYGMCMDKSGNITNNQISLAGYNRFWKKEDDIKLYNYIINLNNDNHSFMVSGLLEHDGNNSWIMNKLINDGFKYKELIFDYNSVSRKGDKESKEIIIMNY